MWPRQWLLRGKTGHVSTVINIFRWRLVRISCLCLVCIVQRNPIEIQKVAEAVLVIISLSLVTSLFDAAGIPRGISTELMMVWQALPDETDWVGDFEVFGRFCFKTCEGNVRWFWDALVLLLSWFEVRRHLFSGLVYIARIKDDVLLPLSFVHIWNKFKLQSTQ